MAWTSLLLTCVLLAAAASALPTQKAPRFKACKRNQPADKLNECLRDSIQKAIPELVKGLPDYGLLSIDPLRVQSLQVPRGKSAVSIDIGFKDLDILGFGNVKIDSLDADLPNLSMKFKLHVEGNVYLQGTYKVDGKVLVLPIQGTGRCNVTIVNPRGEVTEVKSKKVMRKNKEYLEVTSFKFVVYETERVHYDLENLFNGNKALGENMNLVLNDNWKEIFEDLIGPVQTALGLAFSNIANRITQKLPFDVLIPKT